MKKSFVGAARTAKRAYSPAVITEDGKTIWLAGHTGAVDDAGKSLAGDFDASEFEDDYAGAVDELDKTKIEGGEVKKTPTSTKSSGEASCE